MHSSKLKLKLVGMTQSQTLSTLMSHHSLPLQPSLTKPLAFSQHSPLFHSPVFSQAVLFCLECLFHFIHLYVPPLMAPPLGGLPLVFQANLLDGISVCFSGCLFHTGL